MTRAVSITIALGVGAAAFGPLLLEACSVEDGILGGLRSAQAGSPGVDIGGTGGRNDPLAAACEHTSPVVNVLDSTSTQTVSTCSGRIASTHFLNALCVCSDAKVNDYLVTRGFDSSRGSYQSGQADDSGAAVGINGNYAAVGNTDIAGSFTVAGVNSMQFVGQLLVRGDFHAAGSVTVTGVATVSRNAWLGGTFWGLGPLTVLGELHHAANVAALPLVAGTQFQEPVSTQKACACEAADLLDVKRLVEEATLVNDNARFSIDSNALAAVSTASHLTLPCGRIYLSRVGGAGDVVVDVTGMTALFIGGSVDLSGSLEFRLAPGAELDAFVQDNVMVRGQLSLSSQERPSAGRLYVGGSGDINLTTPWIGNLYAPRCRVASTSALDVWGSIFCREFGTSSYANFIFDRAALDTGRSCTAVRQPGVCSRCGWCSGGTACMDGLCGPCRQDNDCCGQSVCANGSCVPLIII